MMNNRDPNPYKKQNPYKKRREADEIPAGEQTAGKTENFFTSHVKLITFLVCLAVFLAFFGPLSVWRITEWIKDTQEEVQEQNAMPMEALQIIAEKGSDASWNDFRRFGMDEDVDEYGYVTWTLEVKDAAFMVQVAGPSRAQAPQYIRIYCTHADCDHVSRAAEFAKDDITEFIQQHTHNIKEQESTK